ncbi:transposable element Tcb1 transposase [Trichonephila clavipes]|nr:transposable element Tcb1 transposase [Trichonephila clavipes]
MPWLQAMVRRSREKEQKQQHINGTENILLNGCITAGIRNYDQKSLVNWLFLVPVTSVEGLIARIFAAAEMICDTPRILKNDEVETLAYQLNEEAERTERPIRRLSKVMYGSTCADMQVDVMGKCLSSIKHVVGARRNRWQTAGEIARHTTRATGRPISRFTVARRLHGGGLFARRPVRCVPLTPAHRRRRSLWCREHRNWRDNEWGRVLFTDESRFSLSSDSHGILIWRELGSRNHPSNIIERDRYGGRGVLVWGGIMFGSRTDLPIFNAGSVKETRYCNEILLPYVRLFRGSMGL